MTLSVVRQEDWVWRAYRIAHDQASENGALLADALAALRCIDEDGYRLGLNSVREIARETVARIEARSDATENTDAAGTARAGKAPNPKVKAQ